MTPPIGRGSKNKVPMKKVFSLVILVVGLAAAANAQQSKSEWITVKSANLKCWECKERLEKYLLVENRSNFESGIIQWKINMLQGEIKLQFWPDRASAAAIKAAINNAGFDADNEKAEEDAYKKLPPICKRAEDGGGQIKGQRPCHVPPIN
jgi:mercuric ion binding protein